MQLQCEALLALSRLCVNGEAAEVLGQAGACQSLVTATALHANKPTVRNVLLNHSEAIPYNSTRTCFARILTLRVLSVFVSVGCASCLDCSRVSGLPVPTE